MVAAGGKPDVPTWSGIGDFDVVSNQFIDVHVLICGLCTLLHLLRTSPPGVGLAGKALVHGCLPS